MPRKSKFSVAEKIEVVEAVKAGKGSTGEFAARHGVDNQTVRNWIRLFETFGIEGLADAGKQDKFSRATKMAAVQEYLSGGCSQADVCRKFKIRSARTLQTWISEYNRVIAQNQGKETSEKPSFKTGGKTMSNRKEPTRKSFITYQFRLDAVAYCKANENNYSLTAEKFGVTYGQVYTWVQKYERNGAEGLRDRRGRRKDPDEMTELDKLRAENKILRAELQRQAVELEVLKKAWSVERG